MYKSIEYGANIYTISMHQTGIMLFQDKYSIICKSTHKKVVYKT